MTTGVVQNGNVTPGHLATWTTNSVIQDGGPITASQKVLASQRSASFNTTSDQPILIPAAIVAFQLTGIIITNASVSLTNAQGGFYTGAGKTGSSIVASSQAYTSLTGMNLLLNATLTNFANTARFSSSLLSAILGSNNQYALAMYFSLSVAQGAAATADIYLLGIDLT